MTLPGATSPFNSTDFSFPDCLCIGLLFELETFELLFQKLLTDALIN